MLSKPIYLVYLAHRRGIVAICSKNGTEFKNKDIHETCDQLRIKRLLSNPFNTQCNSMLPGKSIIIWMHHVGVVILFAYTVVLS